jgi:DNA-binding phage protein
MRLETIAERAAAIRLGTGDLQKRTGLTAHTVGRTLNGRTEPRHSTFLQIEKAVVDEELRLRDYLLGLHPVKREGEAA